MKEITSLIVLLGIILLVYGLYNCSCKERFQESMQTQSIKSNIDKITVITQNNKNLLEKTNQMRENIKKIISL